MCVCVCACVCVCERQQTETEREREERLYKSLWVDGILSCRVYVALSVCAGVHVQPRPVCGMGHCIGMQTQC